MKKSLSASLLILGITIIFSGCETAYTPANSVHIDPIPSQMLELARVYRANLSVLDQAFQSGIIDEPYYLSAKYQFNKALEEQLVMHEGSRYNEIFTAPLLEED